MKHIIVHALFILAVFAAGGAIGAANLPGDWYQSLQKPWFTPPNWVFGPVWSVLYVLIGWVGARKALYGGERVLWVMQMAFNLLWSPVFFGMQSPLGGMVVIAGMLATIVAFIAREWGRDRLSALLFLPYALWVSIAAALNLAILVLN
ncbi:tryptophan-rich sensory protein [Fertoebacter nigrum]|uniref:Tryptophan-rich sensory protein n=1 Tax=Fertoeibacter niger TaxID=2656921 RepID=A0A8X8KPG6_9RHOB|nr:tryptophan-rich sensory protein [Fertoeibacter niger]